MITDLITQSEEKISLGFLKMAFRCAENRVARGCLCAQPSGLQGNHQLQAVRDSPRGQWGTQRLEGEWEIWSPERGDQICAWEHFVPERSEAWA